MMCAGESRVCRRRDGRRCLQTHGPKMSGAFSYNFARAGCHSCEIMSVMLGVARWIRGGHDDACIRASRRSARVRGSGRRFRFSLPGRVRGAITRNGRWVQRSRCGHPICGVLVGHRRRSGITRGFPVIDIQAAGGLYNSITLEIFPEPMRLLIVQALAPLSMTNFCQQIAQEQHLDLQIAALAGLTDQQKS